VVKRLCLMTIAVIAMWGLKRHYAGATAEDLRWILSPTSQLVGVAAGTDFTFEPGQGYLSRQRLFLIEKSCAGVNFMIAALGMLAFALRSRVDSWAAATRVLAFSIAASYVATVIVNAARITLAMWLAAHPMTVSGLSPSQLHRIEGIVVYFGGLMLLYGLVGRLEGIALCGTLQRR
jgi:exosortase K